MVGLLDRVLVPVVTTVCPLVHWLSEVKMINLITCCSRNENKTHNRFVIQVDLL